MSIAPALLKAFPNMNAAQRSIVGHIDGPLLVIAGPGSGKTFSLVLRTINLLVLLKLTDATRNLGVVGDEDQSLYRFRGATVRNILEFTSQVPGAKVEKLVTNYRSHRRIVKAYDGWMASADCSNPNGLPFRHNKTIEPDPNSSHPSCPAVFCIWGKDECDEAERFANLVAFLAEKEVIADHSQVALQLHGRWGFHATDLRSAVFQRPNTWRMPTFRVCQHPVRRSPLG